MISVQDGQNHVLAQVTSCASAELIAVPSALHRVLASDLRAPFDVPPTDNSAVDGYAVSSADLRAEGVRALEVVAELPAGAVYERALEPGQALRIMTGAPIPAAADTVIPQEVARREGATVWLPPHPKGANVRMRGEDVTADTVVLEAGIVLRPQELGLISSLGFPQVCVHVRPRVALLSTGDEVVEPGQPRHAGQIYDSNRFALRASVEQCGGDVVDLGIVPDVRDELRGRLLDAGRTADIVIRSGGVAGGEHDLVKEGRRRLFPELFEAKAAEPMRKKTGRREFKRGILGYREGRWEVRTTGPQGSGILSSMVAGNCLIVIEEDRGDVATGESVWVEPFVS